MGARCITCKKSFTTATASVPLGTRVARTGGSPEGGCGACSPRLGTSSNGGIRSLTFLSKAEQASAGALAKSKQE